MRLRFLRRALIAAASVVTLALLLIATAHLPGVRARVLEYARARVAREFGVEVNADALRYNLFGVSVELQNLGLAAPGQRPFLEADRIRVLLDRHVFVGTLTIKQIDITRPRIALIRHRDGTMNLPTVQSDASSKPSPIHAGIVALSQISVTFDDESGGHHVSAGPLDLTLDTGAKGAAPATFGPGAIDVVIGKLSEAGAARSMSGTFSGRLGFDGERVSISELQAEVPEGRVTLNGWIDVIAETIRVEAQGRVETNLARVGHLVGNLGDSLSGAATADVTIRGSMADPTVHVVASARNIRYQAIPEASAEAEATYAAGRVEVQRLNVTSDLATALASGSLQLTTAAGATGGNHVKAHLADVDIDRVLDALGVSRPVRLGTTAGGDFDVTLDTAHAFTPDWWWHSTATGSVELTSSGTGLAVDGRLKLTLDDDRWTVAHQIRSDTGSTTIDGVVSGHASQRSDGTFDSTLSGRSRVRIDSLHALRPFATQAGLELPAPFEQIDGSVDAEIDPRGTFTAPRALATIAGRDLRVPDFPAGQLDSTAVIDRRAAKVDSLQARLGPAIVTASGTYSWSGQIDSRFDATVDDLHAFAGLAAADDLPVAGSARIAGTLQGTAQAPRGRAELTAASLSAYEVSIGSVNAQLRLANERVDVEAHAPNLNAGLQGSVAIRDPYRFQADATLEGSSIAALLPASTRDTVAADGTITATLKGAGTLSRLLDSSGELALRALDARVSGIPVALEMPATVSVEPNAFTATSVGLRVGQQTHVQLQGTLALSDVRDGVNIHVEGPLSDLLAMAAPALPDTSIDAQESKVLLDLHVGGTLLSPQPTGTLTLDAASLRYADQPPLTGVALAARIEPARIAVQSLAANWLGALVRGEGAVPLRLIIPDTAPRTGATGMAAWGSRWLASLPAEPRLASLTARVTGISTDVLVPFVDASTLPEISGNVDATLTADADALALDHVRGSLVLDRVSLVAASVPFGQSVPTRIRLDQGRAHIEEFRWRAESNELRVTGGANLLAPDRPVDLAVDGDIDLRILGAFASGIATGGIAHSALTVTGPIAAPEILGRIGVTAGELRLDTPSFAASDVEGTIVIPANRDATIALTGTVNGGAATVQGNVSLADLTAPTGRVTVTARNVTLDYPEGFQTESNADLVLTLATASSTLAGRVDVLNGLYREPIVVSRTLLSGLGAQTGASTQSDSSFLTNLALDVRVATSEQIRVDNNYGRLSVTANLQLTGTAAQPGAIGRVEAEPDGEIYLAGNTYRVESLVVDLANPRAIAPEVSFLADTRVGDVPIEVALQCSAAGVCEREVRSQTSGITDEQAEAKLFGVSSDPAAAGAQLARLLSGELLGIVGQSVRLDTLRLEQAAGRSDLFDDPTLVAGDVNPASRLTIGKRLGDHVALAYSQNLADPGFTMSSSYFAPAGISVRALLLDDQSRTYEFRHEPRFGSPHRKRPATVAGAAIANIRFTGNPGFSESDLRRQLRLADGDRFSFAAWQADRERLIAFYQSRGFFEVRIRARRLLPQGVPIESAPADSTVSAVLLEYAIERGQPTRLDISGFDVPDRIRQQIIRRWSSAIFDGFLERDATLIIRQHLYAERRLQATVVATTQRGTADEGKTLRVTIEPGPPTAPRLLFEGNALLSTATLIEAAERAGPLAAWLDARSFALMVARLYHDDGLLSAEVEVQAPQIQQNESVVRVLIREGESWLPGQVTVDGAGALDGGAAIDAASLTANGRYSPKAMGDAVAKLEQRFRDAGFLSVHVSTDTSLDQSAHRVNVHVSAEPGPRTVLTSVSVEGSAADRAAVARSMRLEVGTPLSASELSATRRRLYETGAYRSVDIDLEPVVNGGQPVDGRPNVPTTGDRAVVARIRVEERPRYTFRYGLAVNDDVVGLDQRSQEIGFAADLENKNVLGRGATFGVSARLRRDQEVGRAYLGVPRFFGLPVQSTMFLSRGREDFGGGTSDVTELSAQQTYRLRRLATVSYGYGLGRNRTTFAASDFDLTVRVARLNGNAVIERRNDPFDPSQGFFTSGSFELSRPGLGSELSFLKGFLQQFQFVPMRHGLVVASAVRLGLARTYRDETLIPSERFFAGGATSVRGYADESLGARSVLGDPEGGAAALIANGEIRFPIYRWLRGVGFVDLGNVYPTVYDLFHSGVQIGTGAGFRLNTPVGLLRLDFGAPVNPRPLDDSWMVHFGLGHAF